MGVSRDWWRVIWCVRRFINTRKAGYTILHCMLSSTAYTILGCTKGGVTKVQIRRYLHALSNQISVISLHRYQNNMG